ncbi:kinase-like protein [Cucurbitaria berberidis CBS 394.84]|uniref:Kinase-like protein n=1 Tax=Cucurbitaria berberidis CBS 394.84 TaxID=1168544 RepID=A0A9P4GSC4_9PLEO|nr:kinase-like protein [Cucurbitaria berberidis CBS 394.84]KAF1851853.1 kinase-like protein [Cucurbitaria berberidis CBS 394.84]
MSNQSKDEQTIVNTNKPNADLIIEDLENYEHFHQLFVRKSTLGVGGDGVVYSYEHSPSKVLIAVKVPNDGSQKYRKRLISEIESFRNIGRHDHIVTMLTYSENHRPIGPAIFLDVCDLGDLASYHKQWYSQERANGRPEHPSEITVWKLLKDMSLGLNFIHNGHETRYVHNDVKPGNILVSRPQNWNEADGIPPEPIFKITDFARLTPFPTPPQGDTSGWMGTPEFAPPLREQAASMRPSADIWSLGATIQGFALHILPIQSKQAFLVSRKAKGKNIPDLLGDPWKLPHWRRRRPTVYRPLDASEEELKTQYDLPKVPREYEPYSSQLNAQYSALWRKDEHARITSEELVKQVVPMIDGIIATAKSRVEDSSKPSS